MIEIFWLTYNSLYIIVKSCIYLNSTSGNPVLHMEIVGPHRPQPPPPRMTIVKAGQDGCTLWNVKCWSSPGLQLLKLTRIDAHCEMWSVDPSKDRQLSKLVRVGMHCEMWSVDPTSFQDDNCQSWSGLMCTVKCEVSILPPVWLHMYPRTLPDPTCPKLSNLIYTDTYEMCKFKRMPSRARFEIFVRFLSKVRQKILMEIFVLFECKKV